MSVTEPVGVKKARITIIDTTKQAEKMSLYINATVSGFTTAVIDPIAKVAIVKKLKHGKPSSITIIPQVVQQSEDLPAPDTLYQTHRLDPIAKVAPVVKKIICVKSSDTIIQSEALPAKEPGFTSTEMEPRVKVVPVVKKLKHGKSSSDNILPQAAQQSEALPSPDTEITTTEVQPIAKVAPAVKKLKHVKSSSDVILPQAELKPQDDKTECKMDRVFTMYSSYASAFGDNTAKAKTGIFLY